MLFHKITRIKPEKYYDKSDSDHDDVGVYISSPTLISNTKIRLLMREKEKKKSRRERERERERKTKVKAKQLVLC